MSKRILSPLVAAFCGFLLVTATLTAETLPEKSHSVVGERAEPAEQKIARLQERQAAFAKAAAAPQKKGKAAQLKSLEANASLFGSSSSVKYTTHPAAYQSPISISFLGDTVELTDGSMWRIHPSDTYKTITWFATDVVVITPNHSLFSFYDYRLTNQNTGESVACDLHLGPIDPSYGSIYTHWITGIDYYRNVLYLEDGSVWSMSTFDRSVISNWVPNDVVIIGVNDGWFSSANPNILINVNMNNYATGGASY